MKKQFIVAQLGARMHYAVPRMLHQAGMLAHFYTDICATKGIGRLMAKLPSAKLPQSIKRLQARIPRGVPRNKITSFDTLGIRYAIQRMHAQNAAEMTKAHLRAGQSLCRKVITSGFDGATGIYAFNSGGLELLQFAKKHGLFAVMEQAQAPISIWKQLIMEEQQRYPEWENPEDENIYKDMMNERNMEEWRQADLVLCASEYTKECMQAAGGPLERCVVVPYGVDARFQVLRKAPSPAEPLNVLTVGTVNLNKGAPYVLAAAKHLKGKAVFRMVGWISAGEKARNELSAHVELTGLVPRSEIMKHYAWADVFLLPSICEGSATVTYEALAAGLPVICTPNTGSVVQDGVEGFIVPIREVDPIVEAVIKLKEHPSLWADMSRAALARSREFTIDAYQKRLLAAITQSPEKGHL